MTEIKLTDFTAEELKCLYVQLGIRLLTEDLTDKERDILSLWQTQALTAAATVNIRETIANN